MKLLIAVDGSECSTRAVEFMAERPWKTDDHFMIISVVAPDPMEVRMGSYPSSSAGLQEQWRKECSASCAAAAVKLHRYLPDNLVEVKVVSGAVAETICNFAESWEADLIILGSHGRKGIQHFFLGSVAEDVLKKSPCSVEVIKMKQKFHVEPKKRCAPQKRDRRKLFDEWRMFKIFDVRPGTTISQNDDENTYSDTTLGGGRVPGFSAQ